MIRCLAIDDEPLALELLVDNISKVPFLQLVASCESVTDAMKVMATEQVDLLFLDIQMPQLSGIDFYKTVKQDTMVIFTTAHSQYAVEGFNLSAVDYLLKPYSYERFETAVKKACDAYAYAHKKENTTDKQFLHVRSDYSLVQIAFADIGFKMFPN